MNSEPVWVTKDAVLGIHSAQLAVHGGAMGVRDHGALEAALGRPPQVWHYEQRPVVDLGAVYAHGISRSHPFVDGNKRTAWVAMRLFLRLNGLTLKFDTVDAYQTMMRLAAGEIDEAAFAVWIAGQAQPV